MIKKITPSKCRKNKLKFVYFAMIFCALLLFCANNKLNAQTCTLCATITNQGWPPDMKMCDGALGYMIQSQNTSETWSANQLGTICISFSSSDNLKFFMLYSGGCPDDLRIVITNQATGETLATFTGDYLDMYSNQIYYSLANCRLTPLPITLNDYKIECFKDNSILKWETASEINNDYFLIEKSVDGKIFEKIAIVKGQGNSNSFKGYSYLADNTEQKENYFKLSQVDFDGTTTVLGTLASKCSQKNDEGLQIVFFGKATTGTNSLIYKSTIQGQTELKIFDINGKAVIDRTIESAIGKNTIDLDIMQGVYFVLLSNGKDFLYKKVMF